MPQQVKKLKLSREQASAGAAVTIPLPTGTVRASLPPVQTGGVVKIRTAQGDQYLRVRVTPSIGRRLTMGVAAVVLLFMFGLGPIALVTAAVSPPPDPNAAPLCSGQVMSPGDICQITTEGGSTNYTYLEMQQMQTAEGNSGLVAVGVMCTAIDVVAGVIVYAKRRRALKHPVAVLAPRAAGS